MRFWKPWRRLLLKIADYLFEERILDYLYPDNCVIEFAEEEAS